MSNNNLNTTTNPTTTEIRIDTWTKWFDSRKSSEFVNKQAQEELFQAFDSSIDPIECKKKLIDHQEVLFLFKETFENTLNVFHHVIEIGGTVYDNNIEFGFIQGVDSDLSTLMTPDTTTLLETPEGTAVAIPTVTNLLAVKSIDDINALTNGTTTTYKPCHFIPITPFLCQTVSESIEKNEGDCKSLLLAVVLAIKQFDTEFDGNADYTNKAKQKCKDILYWLYLSSKADSPVKSIPTTVSKSRRIRDKLIEVTSTCIKGNTTSNTTTGTAEFANAIGNHLKRPLKIIATSNTTQSDILRSFQVQHERNNDKSSRSFTKLPS